MRRLIAVFGLLFLAVACTNDEDIYNPIEPFTIVGSWKMVSIEVVTPIDLNGDGIAGTDLMEESNCYQNERLIFGLDNTGVNLSTSYLELTVNIDFPTDAEVESECIQESENTNFSYLYDEGMITITDEFGDIMTGSVNPNKEMIFVIPNGQVYFDEDFEVVLTENLTITFVKED